MNNDWIAWTAGIIEGEGCLYIRKGRAFGHASVEVAMTDSDIIERLACIWGFGLVRKRIRNEPRHKDQYVWKVSQRDHALKLLTKIRPYLGKRRGDKADDLLIRLTGPDGRSRKRHFNPRGLQEVKHAVLQVRGRSADKEREVA